MFCCFYISCSVTAQQSLPNVVKLTQQCVYVHKTVSECMYEREREREWGVDKRACSKCCCTVFLKHLLSEFVCVCPSLPCSSRQKWTVCICACLHVFMCSAGWGFSDWWWRQWLVATEMHECRGRVCWIKKQVDCMMQNYTDGASYSRVSFMHWAMVDGAVFKQELKPALSIF